MPTSKPTHSIASNKFFSKDSHLSTSESKYEIDSPPRRIVSGEEYIREMSDVRRSMEECTIIPIATVLEQLNKITDNTVLMKTADTLMKELQGVRDHYGVGPSSYIANEVMYHVKEYASNFIKYIYEEDAVPGTDKEYATLLPSYFPNGYIEAFRYQPDINEKKVFTNPSLRP